MAGAAAGGGKGFFDRQHDGSDADRHGILLIGSGAERIAPPLTPCCAAAPGAFNDGAIPLHSAL
jgi:hypothetical protein